MTIIEGIDKIKATVVFLEELGIKVTAVEIKEQIECETGETVPFVVINAVLSGRAGEIKEVK